MARPKEFDCEMKGLFVHLPIDQMERVERFRKKSGLSKAVIARRALDEYLDRQEELEN